MPTGVQAYDSFVPVASATVTSARWYGYYTGAGPGTDSWMIGFYADNSGAPGALLSSQTLPAASVVTTQLGTVGNVTPTPNFYQFDAALPAPFAVTADVKYWFSAVSIQTSGSSAFYWTSGSGGDSAAVSIEPPEDRFRIFFDLAFSLFAVSPNAFQLSTSIRTTARARSS